MATLMITGGKIGALIGRKRAFAIGCVIYGAGSFTTSLAQSLPVLIVGWSVLEGIGAALIMPAIVALVAANFAPEGRPRAYGLVMSAGAIAVAVGPLIGAVFLGLSAIDTGVRRLPLSVTLLLAAAGIPRFWPAASPRRTVRLALLAMLAGTVVLLAGIDEQASAEIVAVPLLLLG